MHLFFMSFHMSLTDFAELTSVLLLKCFKSLLDRGLAGFKWINRILKNVSFPF